MIAAKVLIIAAKVLIIAATVRTIAATVLIIAAKVRTIAATVTNNSGGSHPRRAATDCVASQGAAQKRVPGA
jgi:hypothetical protein